MTPPNTTDPTPFDLIAVHGNGGGGFRFARIVEHLPDHITFEAITLPGFADKPRNPTLQTMHDYAKAIQRESTLLTADSGRPKVMLGTGIGGSFALEYVQHYRHLDGLILHAPVGTRLDKRLFPRLMSLPGMPPLGRRMFASRLTRPLLKRLLFVDHTAVPDDYLNRFFDEYGHCTVFGQMFSIINSTWWNSLQPQLVGTVLLWGEEERVLSVDQIEDYKILLPNHFIRTVPDWDHFPMVEQPQAYAHEIARLGRKLLIHPWQPENTA